MPLQALQSFLGYAWHSNSWSSRSRKRGQWQLNGKKSGRQMSAPAPGRQLGSIMLAYRSHGSDLGLSTSEALPERYTTTPIPLDENSGV